MPEQTVWALVAYDGTDFFGFQRQASERTVQAELERALADLYGRPVTVHGAGRTDAGVHARGQVIGYTAPALVPPERVARALRGRLPADVAVRESGAAPADFDPRRQAVSRTYRYTLAIDSQPHPLRDRFATRVDPGLDVEAMAAAAAELVGEHDFASFCCNEGHVGSTCRSLRRMDFQAIGECVTVEVEADSFLYKQVRCMIGALLGVGRKRFDADLIGRMLAGESRPPQVAVAPPTGLVLHRVRYAPREGLDRLA